MLLILQWEFNIFMALSSYFPACHTEWKSQNSSVSKVIGLQAGISVDEILVQARKFLLIVVFWCMMLCSLVEGY
jgi:hypothetical protein